MESESFSLIFQIYCHGPCCSQKVRHHVWTKNWWNLFLNFENRFLSDTPRACGMHSHSMEIFVVLSGRGIVLNALPTSEFVFVWLKALVIHLCILAECHSKQLVDRDSMWNVADDTHLWVGAGHPWVHWVAWRRLMAWDNMVFANFMIMS